MITLASMAWPDVDPARMLVVPLGSTEQHGPHLPFSTDTAIAEAIASGLLAQREAQCVLAPSLPFGASGEHQGFPGTLSIGSVVLAEVLIELVRSATESFPGVVFVNGHGGNHDALSAAVSRCVADGRRVLGWSPSVPTGGDLHAGRTETSVMSGIHPELVRGERVAPGATGALDVLLVPMRRGGVRSVAASGVLGDPTGHSAQEGDRILAAWTHSLVLAFDAWNPAPL